MQFHLAFFVVLILSSESTLKAEAAVSLDIGFPSLVSNASITPTSVLCPPGFRLLQSSSATVCHQELRTSPSISCPNGFHALPSDLASCHWSGSESALRELCGSPREYSPSRRCRTNSATETGDCFEIVYTAKVESCLKGQLNNGFCEIRTFFPADLVLECPPGQLLEAGFCAAKSTAKRRLDEYPETNPSLRPKPDASNIILSSLNPVVTRGPHRDRASESRAVESIVKRFEFLEAKREADEKAEEDTILVLEPHDDVPPPETTPLPPFIDPGRRRRRPKKIKPEKVKRTRPMNPPKRPRKNPRFLSAEETAEETGEDFQPSLNSIAHSLVTPKMTYKCPQGSDPVESNPSLCIEVLLQPAQLVCPKHNTAPFVVSAARRVRRLWGADTCAAAVVVEAFEGCLEGDTLTGNLCVGKPTRDSLRCEKPEPVYTCPENAKLAANKSACISEHEVDPIFVSCDSPNCILF